LLNHTHNDQEFLWLQWHKDEKWNNDIFEFENPIIINGNTTVMKNEALMYGHEYASVAFYQNQGQLHPNVTCATD
jgi:hypothetical protein